MILEALLGFRQLLCGIGIAAPGINDYYRGISKRYIHIPDWVDVPLAQIIGDAFAPRNDYAMAIDLVKEPPMFRVSDTHWAKTWLLDPRAPKVDMPVNIRNLHEKMVKVYGDFED